MNPAVTRNRTPEPPYCWQSKEALRKIREHLDGDSLLPYALSVYCALTENASNKGKEEFTTLQSHLAQLAGVSVRTVRRVLPDLHQVGVIDYSTPRLRGPITFRLLSVQTPRPHVRPNRPNVRPIKISAFQAANRSNIEVTEKELGKEHPPTSLDCVEDVCASPSSPGSDGVNGEETPGTAIEPVAAKAASGEASPARAGCAREKPAAGGRAGDAGFAEFWSAYPRKVGKLDAGRAWARLKPPLAKVLAVLEAWRSSPVWLKEGGRYIPYPATWLNRGGWEDELPDGRQQPESFI